MNMRFHAVPLGLLLALGCAGTHEAATTPEPAPTAPTSPDPGPAIPSPSVQVSAPACGYGGSAPAATVFVDVQTSVPLTGVRLSFTLADPTTGATRGASRAPETLVISPMERGLTDFSTQGTLPFDGTLAAGTTTRLEYFAGLGEDPRGEATPGAFGGPVRVDVVVETGAGIYTTRCDTAQMWPSS